MVYSNLNLIIPVELLMCATNAHMNKMSDTHRHNSCHLQVKAIFLSIYVTINYTAKKQ